MRSSAKENDVFNLDGIDIVPSAKIIVVLVVMLVCFRSTYEKINFIEQIINRNTE